LTFEDLSRLPLHSQVVKETLRLHSPIHSIMRAVKSPMPVEGTPYVIPTTHVLLAAPGVTSKCSEYFPEPELWEPHRWDAEAGEKYTSLKPIMTVNAEDDEKTDYGYGLVSKGASSPYLPFGAGRHRCIGEQFAYVQLQTILVTMVQSFKFRNLDGRKGVVNTDYSVSLDLLQIHLSLLTHVCSLCSRALWHQPRFITRRELTKRHRDYRRSQICTAL
jgi:cytochrome P450